VDRAVTADGDQEPATFLQRLDLLRQIEEIASPATSEIVRRASEAVNRGVVAYTGV